MSMDEARKEIAAAITGVAGVTGHPYYRQTTRPYDAVVAWDGSSRDASGFDRMNRWSVLVILPNDHAAAEKAISDHLDAWVAALNGPLVVTEATPAQLTLDTGMVPAVVIEGARAHI